jgi:hypothetical protein
MEPVLEDDDEKLQKMTTFFKTSASVLNKFQSVI